MMRPRPDNKEDTTSDKYERLIINTASTYGQLKILIRLVFLLVGLSGYFAVLGHNRDKQMIEITAAVHSNTAQQLLTSKTLSEAMLDYNNRITLLDRSVASISEYCCSEVDNFWLKKMVK